MCFLFRCLVDAVMHLKVPAHMFSIVPEADREHIYIYYRFFGTQGRQYLRHTLLVDRQLCRPFVSSRALVKKQINYPSNPSDTLPPQLDFERYSKLLCLSRKNTSPLINERTRSPHLARS